jgi:predicted GNAT family acetyltransferase
VIAARLQHDRRVGEIERRLSMTAIEIKDEREGHSRYSAYIDGFRIGFASCIQVRDTVLLPYVEVDLDRRDLGIGSLLVRRVMDDARTEGNTVLPLCPFARRWTDLHSEYLDVARRPKAGELTAVRSLLEADRTMRVLHHDDPKSGPEPEPAAADAAGATSAPGQPAGR